MEVRPLVIDIDVRKDQQKHHWEITPSGSLQIHHKEPESRDANQFVINTIAVALGISHDHITILHGVELGKKRVKINKTFTFEELANILGAVKTHD